MSERSKSTLPQSGRRGARVESVTLSAEANARLELALADYKERLQAESLELARENRLDSVATVHVDLAKRRLETKLRRKSLFRMAGTIGGIVTGASLSALATLLLNGQGSSLQIVIVLVVASLGMWAGIKATE